ncbi:MAG: serine/threonine protein kinase, partial [Deltaproteobacteria bacterium]
MVGRCEVFDEIACGGMATIHLGRMRGAGGFSRTVAVKRMHPHISRSPDFVAMFLDEARIVARVSHPNVVSTLDLVEDQGDLFIIMEYVEGLSLAALLRAARSRGERAPLNVIARIATDTLRGLHAAHEATDEDGDAMDIVHRDMSPENVLVGVDGYPRVLDFGVARASVRLSATRDGQVKGKVAYMTPEQVIGQKVDRRTDVYAVSAVLWQALTGQRLWKVDNLMQLAHRMLNDPIPAPSTVSDDVPTTFDAIVLRGLERDLDKRWRTAAEMADALEDLGGLAPYRQVGLWVRRLGGEQLAGLAATVAAVEAKDKARRAAAKGRAGKSGSMNLHGAQAKLAALQEEAEREGPRGPPIPARTGQTGRESGVVTASDVLLWGESDEHFRASAGSQPHELAAAASAAAPQAAGPAPGAARAATEDESPDPATVQMSREELLGADGLPAQLRAQLQGAGKGGSANVAKPAAAGVPQVAAAPKPVRPAASKSPRPGVPRVDVPAK